VYTAPIPGAVAQQVAHAAEGVSGLLISALEEDASGGGYSYLPMIINSLLALKIAVEDYCNMIQRSVHVVGGAPMKFRRQMPRELGILMNAAENALDKIFFGYSDMIPTFAFPEIYATEISERLQKVKIR
jgi:hypothetical protein